MGHALSAVLLAITVGSLLLQLRTVRRLGTAGLAPSTWFGLVASSLVWLGYGLATREPTLVVINLVVLAIGVALAVAIVRASPVPVPVPVLLPYLVGPALVWCGAWLTDAAWLLGVAGTALVVGRLLPQLVRAVQAVDRSGISPGAWAGHGATNVVWAVYGFGTGDPFVTWPSVASALLSFMVVAIVLGAVGQPVRWRARLLPVDPVPVDAGAA